MRRYSFFLIAVVLASLCGCGGGGLETGSSSVPPSGGPGTGIPGIDSIRKEFLDAVNQARSVARMCGNTSFPAASPVA